MVIKEKNHYISNCFIRCLHFIFSDPIFTNNLIISIEFPHPNYDIYNLPGIQINFESLIELHTQLYFNMKAQFIGLFIGVFHNVPAHDEACAKYLDRKLDETRFKKLFITEIRNLVEADNW